MHAGIAAAHRAFGQLKIDTVVIRGVNDDELIPLIEYGRSVNGEVRFIEYMDVGGASRWSPDRVVSRREMLEVLTRHYGPIAPIDEQGSSAPADRYALPDGTTFGIIASTTDPFCRTCDRSRLTADGMWYLCLYATRGLDLRAPLRAGMPIEELTALIGGGWRARDDAGRGGPTRARRSPRVRAGAGSAQEGPAPRNAYPRRLTQAALAGTLGLMVLREVEAAE